MFYEFGQNNSGGTFDIDKKSGIGEFVIVEANSAKHANSRAEEIGLYFNGCESGADCSCCGDRWYEKWEDDPGDEFPAIYGMPAENYNKSGRKNVIFVHYLNGTVKEIG